MGNLVCCAGGGDAELLQRQQLLQDGAEFTRQAPFLGGVLRRAERIHLQLNPSATRCVRAGSWCWLLLLTAATHTVATDTGACRLQWRQATGSSSGKTEEIPVSRVARVCVSGASERGG